MTAGQMPHVDAVLADQLLASFGIGGVKLERDAVAGEQVAELMATGSPLLTHAVNDVSGPMGDRPRRERLLDLRVSAFLGVTDPLTMEQSISPSAVARWRVASSVNGIRVWYWSMASSRARLACGCSLWARWRNSIPSMPGNRRSAATSATSPR